MAVELLDGLFHDEAVGVKFLENLLGYFGLDGVGGTAEFIEGDMEPCVDVPVHGIVPVAKRPGGYALLGGPGFGGGAVFVGSAYIEGLETPDSAKPGKDIGGEHLDKVAQMGHVIHIGES
jgi:hypothetical protein